MPRFERRGSGGGFRGGSRGGGSWGRGGDRGGYDMPKPVKVGEEYDVEISEVGSKGDGIARVKNFVVFVNGVKQGEKCKIVIKEVRNRFAIGEKSEGASAEPSEATEATEAEAGSEDSEAEDTEDASDAEESTEAADDSEEDA